MAEPTNRQREELAVALSALSAHDLKDMLAARDIPHDQCLEKDELIALLVELHTDSEMSNNVQDDSESESEVSFIN